MARQDTSGEGLKSDYFWHTGQKNVDLPV
jgi:hypothetical protein